MHHALCQTIVRVAGTPYAETNAVMLAHCVAFMESRARAAIAALAVALGGVRTEDAAPAVARLAALAGPRRLSELGVEADALDGIVAAAIEHPGVAMTPGEVSRADLEALVTAAF